MCYESEGIVFLHVAQRRRCVVGDMIVSGVCEGGKTRKGTLLGIKLDELFGERDAR